MKRLLAVFRKLKSIVFWPIRIYHFLKSNAIGSFVFKQIIAGYKKLVDIVSWPLWIYDFLKRHSSIRSFIIVLLVVSTLIIVNFGIAVWIGIVGFVGRLAFMMLFMIGQFLLLFTFLSSTKNIELYPGDKGMFSFDKDYFGNEYLVNAVRQWISSLSAEGKEKLDEMGAEAINGMLFEGPPGTGKTLLAQCLASDSHAAFFGCSGTDFQAMFIGVGPMKVMRLFSKARAAAARYGASIVFIDEIDAVGGNRGGVSGNQPMGMQSGGMFGGGGLGVLSKILTEMDGTKEVSRRDQVRNRLYGWMGIPPIRTGLVLTIGATNRVAALDPALIRPGRLDKIIRIDPPDKTSREKIIHGYLRKVTHSDDVEVARLVEDTGGVTPAQLASAIQRGAPRFAINDGRKFINHLDIEKALQEDLVGLANPISDFEPIQKKQVAVHESGHAVVSYILQPQRRITHVSIIRRGSGILGYMMDVEKKEVFSMPIKNIAARIQIAIAGHIATELVLGEAWTGASFDFDHVRFYLRKMAELGEFGGIPFEGNDPFVSTRIKERADRYLQKAIQGTRLLLIEHMDMVLAMTDVLIFQDELNSNEVYELLGKYYEQSI